MSLWNYATASTEGKNGCFILPNRPFCRLVTSIPLLCSGQLPTLEPGTCRLVLKERWRAFERGHWAGTAPLQRRVHANRDKARFTSIKVLPR